MIPLLRYASWLKSWLEPRPSHLTFSPRSQSDLVQLSGQPSSITSTEETCSKRWELRLRSNKKPLEVLHHNTNLLGDALDSGASPSFPFQFSLVSRGPDT